MRDTLLQIRTFHGLIPLEFKSNTATVPIDINVMKDGKDETIKQMTATSDAHRSRCSPLQLLVNGLVTGCALGVVAISFSLIYATTKIFHVAHAGVYTWPATSPGGWSATARRKSSPCCVAVAACAAAGRADPEPALRAAANGRRATHLVVLIASLGVLAVIQNIIAAVFTPNILQFPCRGPRTSCRWAAACG